MVTRHSNYIFVCTRILACRFAAGLLSVISSHFSVVWLIVICLTHLRQSPESPTSVTWVQFRCMTKIFFFLSLRYTLQYNVNMDFHSLLAEKFCMFCLLFFVFFVCVCVVFFCLFSGFFHEHNQCQQLASRSYIKYI